MGRLDGKLAVVTGAGAGLGAAIAAAMAEEGAGVAALDLNPDTARAVAERIEAAGGRALAVSADLRDEAAVKAAFDQVLAEFGRVDILVNNAGFAAHAELAEMSLDEWQKVLDGNLRPPFLCTRAVLPGMIERRGGSIINMGSQLGFLGAGGMSHYTVAKAGIHGLTKALARELAPHGIRVNAIAPGPVETANLRRSPAEVLEGLRAEIPLGRFATVEEIAPFAVLLAADEASYCTGSVVNVSGGHLM